MNVYLMNVMLNLMYYYSQKCPLFSFDKVGNHNSMLLEWKIFFDPRFL